MDSPSKVKVNMRNSTLWTGTEGETDLTDPENIRFADDLRIDKWTFYCLKHTRFSPLSIPIKFHYKIHYYLLLFVYRDISLHQGPVRNPYGKCKDMWLKTIVRYSARHVIIGIILSARTSPQMKMYP